jgi:hypothetical protein
MTKNIGWLAIVGFFSLLAAAEAQTPAPPTATTAFDGTYTPVSLTPVNSQGPLVGTGDPYIKAVYQCPLFKPAPLTIERGQARISNPTTGNQFAGTVGPQGELAMRLINPGAWPEGIMPGNEIILSGRINRDGTVRARSVMRACAYDVVWQKAR